MLLVNSYLIFVYKWWICIDSKPVLRFLSYDMFGKNKNFQLSKEMIIMDKLPIFYAQLIMFGNYYIRISFLYIKNNWFAASFREFEIVKKLHFFCWQKCQRWKTNLNPLVEKKGSKRKNSMLKWRPRILNQTMWWKRRWNLNWRPKCTKGIFLQKCWRICLKTLELW